MRLTQPLGILGKLDEAMNFFSGVASLLEQCVKEVCLLIYSLFHALDFVGGVLREHLPSLNGILF